LLLRIQFLKGVCRIELLPLMSLGKKSRGTKHLWEMVFITTTH